MLSLRLGLRSLLLSVAAFASVALTSARAIPPALRVHPDGHYLQTADGRPFFWLGDTAWELFHRTTREEASYYLATRARQGFTVIQAVALAEFNGIRQPDALGQRPFIDEDPTRPNEAYFDRLVEIVDEAAARGLYVAVLPTWADKLTAPWGDGPRLFRLDNLPVARGYARYLGAKLKGRTNVIWMLGGDRPPRLDPAAPHPSGLQAGFPPGQDWRPIWREIAAGLAEGTATTPLCLYHPGGGMRTAPDLHGEPWLAVNGMQSGHGGGHDVPVWDWVARDFALTPAKPTLDLEPNYEDHPVNPWPEWDPASGYFRDYDVRKQTYRSVLAGACGVTYGNHSVWGFQSARNGVINHGERDWINALDRPGARQMRFLRLLVESRPFFRRIPDDSLFTNPSPAAALHMTASRDRDGSYAFIYFPLNEQAATIHLGQLGAGPFRAWWFDPRTGFAHPIGTFDGAVSREFKTPPYGPDWVLVLDRAAANYGAPGAAPLP